MVRLLCLIFVNEHMVMERASPKVGCTMKRLRVVMSVSIMLLLIHSVSSCVFADVQIQVILRDAGISPKEIGVTKGETLRIQVMNRGNKVHNLVIPDMYIFTQNLAPNASTTVSFVPDKTGRFNYYSDTGGRPEPGLQGILTVRG